MNTDKQHELLTRNMHAVKRQRIMNELKCSRAVAENIMKTREDERVAERQRIMLEQNCDRMTAEKIMRCRIITQKKADVQAAKEKIARLERQQLAKENFQRTFKPNVNSDWIEQPEFDETLELFNDLIVTNDDMQKINDGQAFDSEDIDDNPEESDRTRKRKLLRRENRNVQQGTGLIERNLIEPKFSVEQVAATSTEMTKFGSSLYRGKFNVSHNFKDIDILRMSKHIDNMFRDFVGDKLAKGLPDDFISVTVQHQDLPDSIYITSRVKNFEIEEFANRIYKTCQSQQQWLANGQFNVEVLITRKQQGSGFPSKRNVAPETPREAAIKSRSIVTIKNTDAGPAHSNSCGYWAIALGIKDWETKNRDNKGNSHQKVWDRFKKNSGGILAQEAQKICRDAGVEYSEALSSDTFSKIQEKLLPYYQLIIVDGSTTDYIPLFKGDEAGRQIYLFLADNHYDLITKIHAMHKKDFWCHHCWTGFKEMGKHKCEQTCQCCRQPCACQLNEGEEQMICYEKCHRAFNGSNCFKRHQDFKICEKYKKCTACEVEYQTRYEHECHKVYCKRCEKNCESGHHCFLTPKDKLKLQEQDAQNKIIVAFDIESELTATDNDRYIHKPNLVCAKVVCDDCYNYEIHTKSTVCGLCGPFTKNFAGYECIKDFGDYLYKNLAKKAEKKGARVVVLAHNFQRYDGQFIFRDLFERDFNSVEPVMVGLKLLKIDVGNVRFIDSLSFFQQKLASLPKSFGFESIQKGDFPHKFNTFANKNYVGQWPSKEFYDYNVKTDTEKSRFDDWYDTVKDQVFDMQHELLKYCETDTKIFLDAVQRFRSLFRSKTELDPLTRSFTLASIGLETYRAMFLKDRETIGITPVNGYSKRNHSAIADAWLDMMEIHHGHPIGREVKRGNFFADGAAGNKVYEYFGCFYHGCPQCIPNHRDQADFLDAPNELYAVVEQKRAYYRRQNFELFEIWDCQLERFRRDNPEVNDFIKERIKHSNQLKNGKAADLREALAGGRTNNLRFHYKCEADEVIRYLDVTSEYPYVLKNRMYPVGHPQIINSDFGDIENYFGFVKCTVLPPKNLFLPVLPMKVNDKLSFILCQKCAESNNQVSCCHNDKERSLTSTWSTVELEEAIKRGYIVKEIFQILHYETKSDDLFKEYINMWLQTKQEASGWTLEQQNDIEKQREFFNDYKEREGVELNPDNMTKNNGLRFIAKLMLNSFWGKLAQRPNMPTTALCKTQHEFYNLLRQADDKEIKINGIKIMNDRAILVNHEKVNLEDCSPGNTNVAIASFVTSYARLHLYKYMDRVVQSNPDHLLYFDTDSVIFVEKKGENMLQTGNFLGELTDEIADYGEGAYIREFVSGGPKNYAYEVVKPDGSTSVVTKTKGIRTDGLVLQTLTLKKMIEFVELYINGVEDVERTTMRVKQHRFCVNPHTHEVFTADVFKIYRVVSEKRRIIGNRTLPFGYVDI